MNSFKALTDTKELAPNMFGIKYSYQVCKVVNGGGLRYDVDEYINGVYNKSFEFNSKSEALNLFNKLTN